MRAKEKNLTVTRWCQSLGHVEKVKPILGFNKNFTFFFLSKLLLGWKDFGGKKMNEKSSGSPQSTPKKMKKVF